MVRFVDNQEREKEILNLIVENHIKSSKPISSAYLCEECKLGYSAATVRNVMLSLEKQGLLSQIHTSSGRVPTKLAFKRYVENFSEKDITKNYPMAWDFCSLSEASIDEVINYTLDCLVQFTGYTSLVALSGKTEGFFYKGMRLILEQPEFEDISRLKDIFYVLEEKMDLLQNLLFECIDEKTKILIGDEIGFNEITDCSLVVSGLKKPEFSLALALLGPMRMNYPKAMSCLSSAKNQLNQVVEEWL